jgi:hypothetical protein
MQYLEEEEQEQEEERERFWKAQKSLSSVPTILLSE